MFGFNIVVIYLLDFFVQLGSILIIYMYYINYIHYRSKVWGQY